MKKKMDARMIAVMGLLIALMIVFARILSFELPLLKLSFTFVPQLIMAMLFGPIWTGIGSTIADMVGMMLLPKATFFLGFTFNAFLGGVIYGWFFYKKEVTLKRAFLCTLTNTVVITLCLTPIWLAMMFNIPLNSWAIWGPRLLKAGILLPVQTALIYIVGQALPYKLWRDRFDR